VSDHVQVCRFEHGGVDTVGVLFADGSVCALEADTLAALLALPLSEIRRQVERASRADDRLIPDRLLAPCDRQEIWAAGVTYERSREARVAESGLVDVYTRAYESDRPELFFKAPAERVVAPGEAGRLREDSTWDACEPELVAVVNAAAEIVGYAIGNDLCSRSIEADNPLYLPQAKLYTDSCLLTAGWTPAWSWPGIEASSIAMTLRRGDKTLWEARTSLERLRRRPEDLVSWLFRELDFPAGAFLLTGTGLVAPDEVMLEHGDEVAIQADGLGELRHALYRRDERMASA
jgi:2-dehydro-3-deoxy-D-arabinonate dehydratase